MATGTTEKIDVQEAAILLGRARAEMGKRIVGKRGIVDGILMGVAADGHVLMEGVPGLAKTLAVKTFSEAASLSYRRIQFTPDLLPGDITGTLYYDAESRKFVPRTGPIFANIVLADEINRAPAKVQSALLEAMEERQVTIGDASLPLPAPFFVLATQNPIEHEGTFRLPEAQLDRFMLKVTVDYPDAEEESEIARRAMVSSPETVNAVLDSLSIAALRRAAASVSIDNAVLDYAVSIVRASRPGQNPSDGRSPALRELSRYVEYGAGPRATIHLCKVAKVCALFEGRAFVSPDDVKMAAPLVLAHRIVASYESEAESISVGEIVLRLLSLVPVP